MADPPKTPKSRFEYIHDTHKWPPRMVDIHQVQVPNRTGSVLSSLWVPFLVAILSSSLFMGLLNQDRSVAGAVCEMIVVGVGVARLLRRRIVEKESVVIIPAFGVQLETQYRRGRVVRRFVPCNSILKPVLIECATPVTSYWSLALILCDEDDLMLVFKELRAPLNMLVPIWKALCAGIEGKNCEANKSDLKEQ